MTLFTEASFAMEEAEFRVGTENKPMLVLSCPGGYVVRPGKPRRGEALIEKLWPLEGFANLRLWRARND